MRKNAVEAIVAFGGNFWAWFSATEQLWFPTVGAYVRFVAPAYDLPDLRGPFLFLTLCYIGLRAGDLWARADNLDGDL